MTGIEFLCSLSKKEVDFESWLMALISVTGIKTGLSAYELKINESEARKVYDDGLTTYQCFRENWNIEQDGN